MPKLQKGFANILLIVITILLLAVIAYLTLVKKSPEAVISYVQAPTSTENQIIENSPDSEALYLSDKYYFGLGEPVVAVQVLGKFYSRALLTQYLSMDRTV